MKIEMPGSRNESGKIAYQDQNITLMIENEAVYVGNIVYECFRRSIPMHVHSDNSYEIHYISAGHGFVNVDASEYEVLPNTLYITGPHVEHSMIPDPANPLTEYCVYLKLSGRNKGSDKHTLMQRFRETTCWYGPDRHGIHSLMRRLFDELGERSLGYGTQVECILKQLIIACVRNYSSEKAESGPKGQRSIDHLFLTIEEAFLYEYATLTLTDLADRLHLSTRQTQRLLQKHYGMNFQMKRTQARMSAASLMLRSTGLHVFQIADALGYSSVEHFSTAFRQYYGESASTYRKKNSTKA